MYYISSREVNYTLQQELLKLVDLIEEMSDEIQKIKQDQNNTIQKPEN